MEKQQKRTVEEVIMGFFPDIDRKELREILKDDPTETRSTSSPEKTKKSQDDQLFFDSAKKFSKNDFYKDKELERIDDMFAKKESNYVRAVKKSVTTAALPSPMTKGLQIPGFMKANIKKIMKLTGRTGGNISLNRFRISALKSDNVIFTLFVTGSQDTDYAFKLLSENLSNLSEDHKSVFVYIIPNAEDDMTYNYKNKKDIIMNKYKIEMRNLDVDRFFFAGETTKPKDYPNNLVQFYKFCCQFPFSYSLFGFNGLRGPKGDKVELEKNLKFLMRYHKQPFIINKFNLFEDLNKGLLINTENKIRSYTWLFVFDLINKDCFNCFKSFSKLIDFKKDRVDGITLKTPLTENDTIKPLFTKELNNNGIYDFSYIQEVYESEASAIIKKKINFDTKHYDFVVIYNSINNSEVNKINYNKQHASNYQIISECLSNICVHNGL